ncbi:hypothetical protein DUI87_22206 [Hirundo rustica rustica]|uniref:Uncharacterized protein n=1 Tax=Hirundo rustica rustica TaxID=333673 RepID=A0A3M0K2D8_HIRRU|nr:hypothetical protein DUI87_22206 [Hirundo rustica rustica]
MELQFPSCSPCFLPPLPVPVPAPVSRDAVGKVAQADEWLLSLVPVMLSAGVRRFATSAIRRSHYEEGPGKSRSLLHSIIQWGNDSCNPRWMSLNKILNPKALSCVFCETPEVLLTAGHLDLVEDKSIEN